MITISAELTMKILQHPKRTNRLFSLNKDGYLYENKDSVVEKRLLSAIDNYTQLAKKAEDILLNDENNNNPIEPISNDSNSYSRKVISNNERKSLPKLRETLDLLEVQNSDIENSEPDKDDDGEIMFLKMDKSQIDDGTSDIAKNNRKISSNDPFDADRDYKKLDSGDLNFDNKLQTRPITDWTNEESSLKDNVQDSFNKYENLNEDSHKHNNVRDYEEQLEREIQQEIDLEKEKLSKFDSNQSPFYDDHDYLTFARDKANKKSNSRLELKLDIPNNNSKKNLAKNRDSEIKFLQQVSSDENSEHQYQNGANLYSTNPFYINTGRDELKEDQILENSAHFEKYMTVEKANKYRPEQIIKEHSDISAGIGIKINESNNSCNKGEKIQLQKSNSKAKGSLFALDKKKQHEKLKMFSKEDKNSRNLVGGINYNSSLQESKKNKDYMFKGKVYKEDVPDLHLDLHNSEHEEVKDRGMNYKYTT